MTELTDTETTEFEARKPVSAKPRPARPTARFDFAALSHPGKVRTNNEDHYLVSQMGRSFETIATNMPEGDLPDHLSELAYGMVVADGMGGMAAGEKASWLAIRTGVQLVLGSPVWTTNLEDPAANQLISRMRDYFRKVDSVVHGEARSDRHLSGMGTTLTLAYIIGIDVFVIHVGDSRAYLFRGGKLEQLTRDHTMAQGLADLGAIKPEDVHRHSKRHVLTNFVGGPTTGVEPDIATLQLKDGDFLMVCSDGLTEMVNDEQISRVLAASSTSNDAAKVLVDLALQNGGRDNVTVALARCQIDRAV